MQYFLITVLLISSFSAMSENNIARGLTRVREEYSDIVKVPCADNNEECQKLYEELTLKNTGMKAFEEAGYFGEASFVAVQQPLQISSQSQQQATGSQNSQSRMGCVGTEFATDYNFCKKVVNQINSMALLEEAANLQHSERLRKEQDKIRQRVQVSNGDTQVAIQGQIDELNIRINQNKNNMIIYGAKAAKLSDLMRKWPVKKNLVKKLAPCSHTKNKTLADCDKAVGRLVDSHHKELLPNLSFRSNVTRMVQEVGLKATQMMMANKTLKDQKKQLEAQLGIVAEQGEGVDEFLTTYCQSPEGQADTEKCGIYGVNPNYNTTGLDNFGDDPEWTAANIGDGGVQGVVGDFNPDNPASGEGQESIRDGLLDFNNEKSAGDFLDNPTAASLGEGGGAGGGGGSGGGGAGGGGAGPGLSAKPNQPGDKDLASLTKVKEGAAYGKSKGSFYKKAKRGKRSRRNDDDDSGKTGLADLGLFGRSPAEDAPVGPQNIALFDLISDRYEKVKEQGRVKK